MKTMLVRLFIYIGLFISANSIVLAQEVLFSPEEKEWITEHPIIEFGYEPHWEPYEIYENGVYTGIVKEYLSEIEKATGIKFIPIKDLEWDESINGLKDGSIHMIPSCGITPERQSLFEFTKPYILDPIMISTREDYHFVNSLADFEGKTIALPKSYYTYELIANDYPDIKIIELSNIQKCLESLRNGEADAFIGGLGVISYYINKKGFSTLKVAAPTEYVDTEVALAVTKDWAIFRDIAQKVFNTIDSKKMSSIRKKWISVRYEHGFPWKKTLSWICIIGSILLVVILIFYFWNRSLKKQITLRLANEEKLRLSLDKIQKQDLQKKALLQEIHHRVKNNLQIITSLIRFQANSQENENATLLLNQSIDRIRAIALIHETTYNDKGLNRISTKKYVESLATNIVENFGLKDSITLEVTSNAPLLDSDTITPLGLIINELVTNSSKFGFHNRENGLIQIDIHGQNNQLSMIYSDNGNRTDSLEDNNLGNTIIEIFTEQLDGEYSLHKTQETTTYNFLFKNC